MFVQVLITCVRTASFYYGRLLEYKQRNGKSVNLSAQYSNLFMKLAMVMADPSKHTKCCKWHNPCRR